MRHRYFPDRTGYTDSGTGRIRDRHTGGFTDRRCWRSSFTLYRSNSVVSNSDDEDRMSEEFGIIQTGGLLKLNHKDAPTLVYQMKILKMKNITMMKLKNSKL